MQEGSSDVATVRFQGSRLAALSLAAAVAMSVILLNQFSASLPGAERPVQSLAWVFGPAETPVQ